MVDHEDRRCEDEPNSKYPQGITRADGVDLRTDVEHP